MEENKQRNFQDIVQKMKSKNLKTKSMRSLSEAIINKVVLPPEPPSSNSPVNLSTATSFEKLRQSRIYHQHNHDLEKHLQRQHHLNSNENTISEEQDLFLKKFSTRSFNSDFNQHLSSPPFLTQQQQLRRGSLMPLQQQQQQQQCSEADTNSNTSMVDCLVDSNKIFKSEETKSANQEENSLTNNKNNNNNNAYQSPSNTASNSNKNLNTTIQDVYMDDFDAETPMFRQHLDNVMFRFNYFVISPDDNCLFIWLIFLSSCFFYNIWLVIARQSFEKLQLDFVLYWKFLDTISDTVYFVDIFVQFRTGYLEQGLLVYNSKKLAYSYIRSKKFLLDIFSLAPLELIQYKYGYDIPMLRFPRFFKIYRCVELYYIAESELTIIYLNFSLDFFLIRFIFKAALYTRMCCVYAI